MAFRRRLFSSSSLLLLFVLLIPPSAHSLANAAAGDDDASILSQLKEQLTDPQGRLSTWTGGGLCSGWYGVECTPGGGRVSALMLAGAGLQGDLTLLLPPLLASLTMLRVLDLSNNGLQGSLSAAGILRCGQQLQEINLSFNNISGALPSDIFLHCSALRKLDLSHNRLSAALPSAAAAAALSELYLSFNEFSGPLPPSFASSASLTVLDVSGNRLSGGGDDDPFAECGAALASINLSSNQFAGGVPPSLLQSCSGLQYLNLSNNRFGGALPPLGLPSIKSLDISGNLLAGELPSFRLSCAALQLLDLSSNNISGSIPPSFASCGSLTHLDLAHNSLSGAVPGATLAEMSSLETLRLSFNRLSGALPAAEIAAGCPRLKVLDLSSNRLSGGVPAGICAASQLQELRLPNNLLFGRIPASLGNCSQLTVLHLSFNDLQGPIPAELGSLAALESLSIWYNRLSGQIPPAVGRLQRLKILILNDNELSGEIPAEIANCTSLEWISASNNRLSGAIPPSLGAMPRLTLLQLGNNSLAGPIPAEIANASMFVWLDLHGNQLSGAIPARLGQHPARAPASRVTGVVFAFVRNDLLSGCRRGMGMLLEFAGLAADALAATPFMAASCNSSRLYVGDVLNKDPDLTSVQYLDLSYNNLSGAIPEEMGNLTALAMLSLGHNQLSGTIPASFSHLSGLGVVDLSYNLLQGSIGPLANCTFLVAIDVSHNNFSGHIPSTGQLTTAPAAGFAGNPLLCGEPLQSACPSSASGGGADCRGGGGGGGGCEGRRRMALLPWANSIVLGVLIAVAFVCMLVVSGIMLRAKGMKLQRDRYGMDGMQLRSSSLSAAAAAACYGSSAGGGGGGGGWKAAGYDKEPLSINVATFERPLRKLTFAHLIEATNGFSQESLIGIGGFGEVYKAELKDGSVVAIKKLLQFSYQGDREFTAEMETLGKIKHRNLVPLLGYCKVGEERLLVYEFMKGGSLEDVLHGGGGGGAAAAAAAAEGGVGLSWEQRKQIMRGAARGLSFLHHNCIPHIIHRDMKSSNVLLDENMEARVSDFGMARLISALDTHLSVSTLAGTPGYVPPEYYQSFRCTTKGDIYSFGVILLELLTGKKPIDKEFFEDTNLVGWVKLLVKEGRPLDALDPSLTSLPLTSPVDEMLQYLAIACDCVQELPSSRPSMLEVVSMLKQIQLRQQQHT